MKKALAVALMLAFSSTMAVAADVPSVAKGKELFGSAKLGTSGKTCESCHPGGSGMEEAAAFEEKKLAKIINTCIAKPLKGKALKDGSTEMKSLVMYIKSLGKPAGK